MELLSYSVLMGENSALLTLKIDTEQPVELRDFVGAFTSLGNEFDRFVRDNYPDAKADPRMYVREVRYGCIEADMITGLAIAAASAMDQILILEDFVRRWGGRFQSLLQASYNKGEIETQSELKDWADAARAIASDPIAAHRIEAIKFKDGKRDVTASFTFSAVEARTALVNIETRQAQLARPKTNTHQRVLMSFTRTDVHDATVNKKSGERVIVREISDKDMPVMFASEMVEQEIRSVIREADENVYKRGFVVDVVAQLSGEKVVAYAISALHSVIEIDLG